MSQNVMAIKATLAGVFAFFTALWGTLGWLVAIWVGCMALDYLSGSLSAHKKGVWSSAAARAGLAGKGGMILFVLGATALDLLLGLALRQMPAGLPFEYSMPICALVLCWYILTETGSLFENAAKLGAHWPPFLKQILQMLHKHLLSAAPKDPDGKGEPKK